MANEKINNPSSIENHENPISQAEKKKELADLLEKVKIDNPDNMECFIKGTVDIDGHLYLLLFTDINGEKKYCIAKNGATIQEKDFKSGKVKKINSLVFETEILGEHYIIDLETESAYIKANVKEFDPNLDVDAKTGEMPTEVNKVNVKEVGPNLDVDAETKKMPTKVD